MGGKKKKGKKKHVDQNIFLLDCKSLKTKDSKRYIYIYKHSKIFWYAHFPIQQKYHPVKVQLKITKIHEK